MTELAQWVDALAHLALCAVCVKGYRLLGKLATLLQQGSDKLHRTASRIEQAADRIERSSSNGHRGDALPTI